MVEAATRGIIDFSQAKFFDPAWRRRVGLLLDGLAMLNRREELVNDINYFQLTLQVARLKEESFNVIAKALQSARQALETEYRPWITPASQEELVKKELTQATAAWENQYGKLDDPETQAKIARTAEAMRRIRELNAENPSGDDLAADRKKRAAVRQAAKRARTREDAVGRSLRTPTRRKSVPGR